MYEAATLWQCARISLRDSTGLAKRDPNQTMVDLTGKVPSFPMHIAKLEGILELTETYSGMGGGGTLIFGVDADT